MSGRTTPKQREADARRAAKNMLCAFRGPGPMHAYVVLSASARGCSVASAKALLTGDTPGARMWARAYEMLEESSQRALARSKRDRAAGAR